MKQHLFSTFFTQVYTGNQSINFKNWIQRTKGIVFNCDRVIIVPLQFTATLPSEITFLNCALRTTTYTTTADQQEGCMNFVAKNGNRQTFDEYILFYTLIEGVSRLQGITAGGDFLGLRDQKSSYKHVSDFGRLQSYDRLKLRIEGNDY